MTLPRQTLASWRPLWPQHHHPTRPWWKNPVRGGDSDPFGGLFGLGVRTATKTDTAWHRADGVQVGRVLPHNRWAMRLPKDEPWQLSDPWQVPKDLTDGWASAEEALAWVDQEYPLAAPRPMAGQVWVWPGGEEHVVGKVYGVAGGGGALLANGSEYRGDEWPPAFAVLVGGPTPWGRDVPWAPGPIEEDADAVR